MTAPISGTGPVGGVAGAVFGGEVIGGGAFGADVFGGGAAAPVLGGVAGETLPFTGSLLTIPLAMFGLALTLGGWLVHRLTREPASD
jgi:hypothetical protein